MAVAEIASMVTLKALIFSAAIIFLSSSQLQAAVAFNSGLELLRGSRSSDADAIQALPLETFRRRKADRSLKGPRGTCHSAYTAPLPTGVPRMPSTWWSNGLEDGAQVQIRTKWLTWVGPAGGNWSNGLAAEQTEPPPVTQFFTVRRTANGQVALQAPNGNLVLESASGSLLPVASDWNQGVIFQAKQGGDNQIQLRGPGGRWLSARSDGSLTWVRTPGELETFDVREVKEVPAIRGVNLGGWLVVEGWMKMSLFDGIPALIDGAVMQIKNVAKGCYLTAEWGGGFQVSCHYPSAPGNWDTFRLRRANPDTFWGGVQLRSYNKWFCSAANESAGSGLSANVWHEPDPVGPSTFNIIVHSQNPTRVQFQAQDGKFLQVDDAGQPSFTCTQPDWEGACAFDITLTDGLRGEWQLGAGLGPRRAQERLDEHRATFITEMDFQYLASEGINLARIPVGYWITQGDKPDGTYVPGGIYFLDRAFEWANKHGLRIMLDLHGAPGSQNGLQETGSRDGVSDWTKPGTDYIKRALDAIEFLAERYATDPAFFGLELLNEPSVYSTPFDLLSQYYEEGYRRVRKHSSCVYVVTSSRWMSTDDELKKFLYGPHYNNVIMDVHWYAFWMKTKTVEEIIDLWRHDRAGLLDYLSEGGRLVLAGEWSVGLPTAYPVSDEDMRRFGEIQLQVYGKHAKAGWAFWSYKLDEDVPAFNFRVARANGWLPFERMDREIYGMGNKTKARNEAKTTFAGAV